jgi:hypothetical protein
MHTTPNFHSIYLYLQNNKSYSHSSLSYPSIHSQFYHVFHLIMDLLQLSTRSKSSSILKSKPSLMKELQKIAKLAITPTSRRDVLKAVSIPQTTRASATGKSYETLPKKPKPSSSQSASSSKRSSSKSLGKTASRDLLLKPSKKSSDSNLTAMRKSAEKLQKHSSTPRGPIKVSKSSPSRSSSKKSFSLITKGKKKQSLALHSKQISSVCFRTATGTVAGRPKPNNQDDYFVIQNYAQNKAQTLIGVMDGHGIYGHEVSAFVKRQLPLLVENNLPYEGKE